MATAIIMPRQGQSVESCLITTWVKKEGDPVKNGDVLFSYETDKSSFDETSTVEGTLLKICKEEGEDVPCLEVTCVIGTPGEDISALLPSSDVSQDAPKEDTTRAAPITMAPVQAAATAAGPSDKISPRAKQLSEKTGALLSAAVPKKLLPPPLRFRRWRLPPPIIWKNLCPISARSSPRPCMLP